MKREDDLHEMRMAQADRRHDVPQEYGDCEKLVRIPAAGVWVRTEPGTRGVEVVDHKAIPREENDLRFIRKGAADQEQRHFEPQHLHLDGEALCMRLQKHPIEGSG